jgi:putative membrane protein
MDGFLLTFLYFVVSIVVVLVGIWIFELITTKYKDWDEIAKGNNAVALSVGGKIVGLCVILLFSILENDQLWHVVIWGVYGIVLQMIVYYLFELLTVKFSVQEKIKEGNTAVGIISFCVSVGLAFVIGASIT